MSKPLKVLIVEDRLTDAELMIYELQRSGFQPEWQRVETEADYLAECKKTPDVILTDHNLPEFDAPRVLELLKKSGLDIPCIVVTGTISEEVAAQRIKDGAADYILKDRMTRLGQAVERALEEKRLRDEKRRSEARKSAILESALDCIVTMDDQGRIIEFNPAAEKTFAYTSQEAIGTEMAELIIPASMRERHRQGLARYLATGHGPVLGKCMEMTAIRKDGSEFPAEVAIARINVDGPPLFTGYIRDISERKRKDEEIQRNLERIRALHDIDAAISSTLDLRGVLDILLEKIDFFFPLAAASTIWMVNKQTGELEPVACRNIDEKEWKAAMLSVPGRLSRMLPRNATWVSARDAQTDKLSLAPDFLRKCGLHSFLRVPLLAKGNLLGTLSVFTKEEHEFSPEEVEFINTLAGQAAVAIHNAQLYEEVQAQTAVLEKANADLIRREEVQKVLKDLSQDILSLETDKLLNKLTAGVRGVFGVDVCDVRILSDSQHWLVRGISGVDPNVIPSTQSGAVHGRTQWIVENRKPLLIPDSAQDTLFPTGDTTTQLGLRGYLGVPLCSKGEVIGVLRVLTYKPRKFTPEEIDLLQQFANGAAAAIQNARLYDETKNQALSLDAANKVKDEFLSVMSHELRTPLSVVMGYAGMLQEGMLGAVTEEQKKILDKMISRGQEQLNIINDIMQTTQLESRSLIVDRRPVDIAQLLQSLKADYSHLAKNLTMKWNYSQSAPQITTDVNKLRQILQNLINNAVKFTPRGEVRISAELAKDAEAMEFRVSDTGIGIPKKELARVFEKFHQVDSSERRLYGGVGIGLYIVKKFTDMLGGHIKIESEVGKWTTVVVTLPLAPSRPSMFHE